MVFLHYRSQAADFYAEHQSKPFFKWVPVNDLPVLSRCEPAEDISGSQPLPLTEPVAMILMTLLWHLNIVNTTDLLLVGNPLTWMSYSIAAPFCSNLVQFVSSGPVVAMELMGDEAMSIWRRLLGPADSAVARKEAPQSARAQFGTDGIKNVGHGSDSLAAAARVREWS